MWKIIQLKSQLSLKFTLLGGQSFRWKEVIEDGKCTFLGVAGSVLWQLKQEDDALHYKVLGEIPLPKTKHSDDYYEKKLEKYFRLDTNLEELYKGWLKAHIHFEDTASKKFVGIRQLYQEPVENLFSFICSQNNHIRRISGLVESLCTNYGNKICDYNGSPYYNFPTVEALSQSHVEEKLRTLSFGYRSKYIQTAAKQILEKGNLKWFDDLTQMNYHDAHSELCTLTGIGPKVADCICLMSLDHLSSIPVDVHVIHLAKVYLPELNLKNSLTTKNYKKVGDKFREIYGEKCGWAQTVLFCSDLKMFEDPADKAVPKKRKKK
ncbi:unnamed protein product [Diamesa tonsa]